MPYNLTNDIKSRQDNPFGGNILKRNIIVESGAQWPTGSGNDYVIPLGVPMAPVGTSGRYKPIRRAQVVTALASGNTIIYVDDADGFAAGDVIAAFTSADSTTNIFTATITAVSQAGNYLVVAALPANATNIVTNSYVEVEENGYLLNPSDAVYLAENIQTHDDDSNTDLVVETYGYIQAQVEISELADNCYDALIPTQLPGIDFIPTL